MPTLVVLFLSWIPLTVASCLHGTSSMPRRINENGTVEVGNFGYTELIGPLFWHTLAKDNKQCAKGKRQSPINLDTTIPRIKDTVKIDITGTPKSLDFENLGTTVEVIPGGGWTTVHFQDQAYSLKQLHFHTPSEHRIEEEYFPLEMHLVHESQEKKVLVLALMYDLHATNTTALISTLASNVSRIKKPGSVVEIAMLDILPTVKFFENGPLRQYSGSLTTPPCKEDILFLVAENRLPIDAAGYNRLKAVLKFNSRFTQGKLGGSNLIKNVQKD